jgi:hypothetical protein
MTITRNNLPAWLCNFCGHIWPCRAVYHYDMPLQCSSCRTRLWNALLPEDPGGELPGA